jgi:hypothetical protein
MSFPWCRRLEAARGHGRRIAMTVAGWRDPARASPVASIRARTRTVASPADIHT